MTAKKPAHLLQRQPKFNPNSYYLVQIISSTPYLMTTVVCFAETMTEAQVLLDQFIKDKNITPAIIHYYRNMNKKEAKVLIEAGKYIGIYEPKLTRYKIK